MRVSQRPLLALFALTAPCVATPPEAASSSKEIVVTGRRIPPPAAVRQATRAITAQTGEQVARFSQPICPKVDGLEDRYDRIVETRMREDAAAVGVDAGKPGCTPNVIVLAVDDGHALLNAIHQSAPAMLSAMAGDRMKRLLAEPGPVHVMTLTELRPKDGPRVAALNELSSIKKDVPSMIVDQASIITLPTRQDIAGALVMIDKPAMMGKTLRQIADHAVMRAYAMTNPDRERPATDTILDLFAGGVTSPPAGLTSFDAGYLRSLYRGPPNQTYTMMTGQMARDINRDNRRPEKESAAGAH